MIGGSSLSGPTQPSILAGGNLRLARGNSWALPRALKLGSYRSGPGGYYSGTLVTVVTAVLKAVSLSGGHTVAMELPTSMGIKQSSSLRLTMYVCMYVCMGISLLYEMHFT